MFEKKPISIDDPSKWLSPDRVTDYLNRIDNIPHRTEGESVLLEFIPSSTKRILDLGSGNGRLIKLVKKRFPKVNSVAIDFSPHMITELRREFSSEETVRIVEHDLSNKLPKLGKFDAIISTFAIHHLTHKRKKEIYLEIFSILNSGGIFCNLDHISSDSIRLKEYFRKEMARAPRNKEHEERLTNINVQIRWLKEIGYVDVDCYWRWLEFALLIGFKFGKDH
ncbi:MAG: class I SAM-dependent methyltransferase [Nitrososphaeraceae archaeon]